MERKEILERLRAVLNTDNGKLLMEELHKELVAPSLANPDRNLTLINAVRRDVYSTLETWRDYER